MIDEKLLIALAPKIESNHISEKYIEHKSIIYNSFLEPFNDIDEYNLLGLTLVSRIGKG